MGLLTVLDLLELELVNVALGEAEGVEGAAGVGLLLGVGLLEAGDLDVGEGGELDEGEGAEVEGDSDAEVGALAAVKVGEGGVVPGALAEELHRDHAGNAEHGPAAVDQLSGLEAAQVGGDLAELEGVEAEASVVPTRCT